MRFFLCKQDFLGMAQVQVVPLGKEGAILDS